MEELLSPLACGCVQLPGYSPVPMLSGFHADLLTQAWSMMNLFPAPLPSLENAGQGWKFQGFHHSSVFLLINLHPATIQEPMKNHLIRTKNTLSPWNFQRLQEICIRNQNQRPNITRKDVPVLLSFRKGFGELLCQELEIRQIDRHFTEGKTNHRFEDYLCC